MSAVAVRRTGLACLSLVAVVLLIVAGAVDRDRAILLAPACSKRASIPATGTCAWSDRARRATTTKRA